MKKILVVATVVKTHIMQFHIPTLKMCKELGFEVTVASKNDYENKADLNIPYCDIYYDIDFDRNPLSIKNISAYKRLRDLIDKNSYDIIHCHTPVGAALARLAAKNSDSKVIYTAHGFHFYKGAPLKNWMIYYPAEKYLSGYTDVLITINKEDYVTAQKNFRAKRTVYLPGVGINLHKFNSKKLSDSEKKSVRDNLGLKENDKMLFSIGELIDRKNHIFVINALKEMKNPNIKYYIAGSGKNKEKLTEYIKDSGLEDQVFLLGYRNDVDKLLNCADLFVFPSKQEGLPVALMEAMATKVPVLSSRIRGCTDLLDDDCLYAGKEEFVAKLKDMLSKNNALTVEKNYQSLADKSEEKVLSELKSIYLDN